jgi:NADH-quinone oxidoreductase subunit N
VLAALAAGTTFGAGMALFYFVAYLFANAGAFLGLAALEAAGEEPTLAGVRNLARRAPVMAAAWLAFLLSLGGIPFVLGFWGKLYVFLAAARAGLWWLVALGALLSVVALYYYLNVVRAMFLLQKGDDRPPIDIPFGLQLAVILCAVIVTAGGLAPHLFVEPALRAVRGF